MNFVLLVTFSGLCTFFPSEARGEMDVLLVGTESCNSCFSGLDRHEARLSVALHHIEEEIEELPVNPWCKKNQSERCEQELQKDGATFKNNCSADQLRCRSCISKWAESRTTPACAPAFGLDKLRSCKQLLKVRDLSCHHPVEFLQARLSECSPKTGPDEDGDLIVSIPIRGLNLWLSKGDPPFRVSKGLGDLQGKKKPCFWGLRKFSWNSPLEDFFIDRYRKPINLTPDSAKNVVSSIHFARGKARTTQLTRTEVEKHAVAKFRRDGKTFHEQALADKVQVRIGRLSGALRLFDEDKGWDLTLRPRFPGDRIDLGITNLPSTPTHVARTEVKCRAEANEKDSGTCTPIEHFAWFYNLLDDPEEAYSCASVPCLRDPTASADGACPMSRFP